LLVGFQITDAGIARQGDLVQSEDGEVIGEVTSGTKTPTLERALGLARVSAPFSAVGTKVVMIVRGRPIKAEIVKIPFYSRLTRSRPA